MRGKDLGKLLIVNLKNHKLRVLLTIITMVILLSSMLFILITVDLYLDDQEKYTLNEVNEKPLKVCIDQVDSNTVDINNSIVKKLKEQGYVCKSDLYDTFDMYMYDEESAMKIFIKPIEELTTTDGLKINSNDVAINSYYLEKDLYDLMHTYLGYNIGDSFKESIYTINANHIEFDGVIKGVVKSEKPGYRVYVNINNFINWKLIKNVDISIEHGAKFVSLEEIEKNINDVSTVINEFNYKGNDEKNIISYNIVDKYKSYKNTQTWMYAADLFLTFLLFIICVKYVTNSLIITINENSKLYALLKVVGLQKRHIFIIVMFEAVLIMLLSMIISIGITYLLRGAIIGVNALLFNISIASFYVNWKIPLLLFLAIFILLAFSVGVKIKKENDNKILDVLKSE